MQGAEREYSYEFADVYDAIDTCDQLDRQLSRLKRQGILSDEQCLEAKREVRSLRTRLEASMTSDDSWPPTPLQLGGGVPSR